MTTDVRPGLDADDAAALALELRLASRASKPLRTALAGLTTALLVEAAKAKASSPDGRIAPAQQAAIRALFAAQVAKLTADVAAAVNGAVAAGMALALKQEQPVLQQLGAALPDIDDVRDDVLADPVLADAGDAAERALADEIDHILRFADAAPLRTEIQVRDLAARAGGAARVVERDVRTAANRALNTTTVELAKAATPATILEAPSADAAAATAPAVVEGAVAEPVVSNQVVPEAAVTKPAASEPVVTTPKPTSVRQPLEPRVLKRPASTRSPIGEQLRVVWVAERGACLVCLALSGQVANPHAGIWFDEDATFGKHPMAVWPPDQPLMGPPRHPHCRCRLRIIAASNTLLPAALSREARRSVARGWSNHASRPARLSAADRLLATANGLPVTVQRRAAADVARGSFSTRHHPRLPALRAD